MEGVTGFGRRMKSDENSSVSSMVLVLIRVDMYMELLNIMNARS